MKRSALFFSIMAAVAVIGWISSANAGAPQGSAAARSPVNIMAPPEYFLPTDKFPQNGKYGGPGPVFWPTGGSDQELRPS